ncbi:MAG: NAD-dependent epimerase/dehydratase family protein [Eggerthellaceae bacterium]|jgi:dTDP-6-deoxy-L-talose 4-dehydrogenase (NAD+)|nr:NAD-dependent epimerase/dehydratase family protein [Eggerthellaceae bacterium]MCH4220667.1 NAD-dependent epimerase/dehydratase family protein [Eggerthellaceae bacterium]
MRVLITGANGYIGRGIVKRLLNDGYDVAALSYDSTGIVNSKYTEYIGDIFKFDFNNLDKKPDVLLHLAWRNGFNHREISHLTDLPLHYQFIQSALEYGISQISIMGSMHEVGYHEGIVDEFTPCNPTTPYGVSKNALRQLTTELCRNRSARMQWLRGFYLVSNDGRGDSIFSKLIRASLRKEKDFPFTSGICKYDFLPYDEFCDQVAMAITQKDVNGIINICSGRSVALGKYVEKFIQDNHLNIKLSYGAYPDRPYDSPEIWGDNSKIKKIMSLRNKKSD